MRTLITPALVLFASAKAVFAQELFLSPQSGATLGSAYSSNSESFIGSDCIHGGTIALPRAAADLKLDAAISQQQLEKELGFAIGGKGRYGIYEGELGAEFLDQSRRDEYSITAIYRSTYYLPGEKLIVQSAPPDNLTPIGKIAYEKKDNWLRTCGSHYINEVHRGAKLFVSIKIQFASRDQLNRFKLTISGSVGGGGLGNFGQLKGQFEQLSREKSLQSTVGISAIQLGGDPAKLSAILGNQIGLTSFTKCSSGEIAACNQVLENLLVYVADTNSGFPSQIKEGAQPGPTTLSYSLCAYEICAAIYDREYPELSAASKLARQEVSDEFERNYEIYQRAKRLLTTRNGFRRQRDIEAAKEAARLNLENILPVAKACFETPLMCPERKKTMGLIPISQAVLEPPAFMQLCTSEWEYYRAAISILYWNAYNRRYGNQPNDPGANLTAEDCESIYGLLKGPLSWELDFRPPGQLSPPRDLQDLDLVAEFKQARAVYANHGNISNIDALRDMSELQYIDMSGNNIKDPSPLSPLEKIRTLDLTNNRLLSAEGLGNWRDIDELRLGYNRLSSLSGLSGKRFITVLTINDNDLVDLQALDSVGIGWLFVGTGNRISCSELRHFVESHKFTRFYKNYGVAEDEGLRHQLSSTETGDEYLRGWCPPN